MHLKINALIFFHYSRKCIENFWINPFVAFVLKISTSSYNFDILLLDNEEYLRNKTLVFIKINDKVL